MNLMIQPNQICLIVKLYNNRPELLPDSNDKQQVIKKIMLPLTQNIHNQTMEYIIYSDESISRGEYFSDFFGGVLVRSRDIYEVTTAIEAKKQELNLLGEIKWVKVSVNYLEKYKEMMDLFFSFIKQDKLKLRIMFRDTNQVPSNLDRDHIANRYNLLYYQFIKHTFGLILSQISFIFTIFSLPVILAKHGSSSSSLLLAKT